MCPVGTCAKRKANRRSQPKRAVGMVVPSATIEVADSPQAPRERPGVAAITPGTQRVRREDGFTARKEGEERHIYGKALSAGLFVASGNGGRQGDGRHILTARRTSILRFILLAQEVPLIPLPGRICLWETMKE